MKDEEKTKDQLLDEVTDLRRRLEQSAESLRHCQRKEESLRISENNYKILIENLPQKIFLKNNRSEYISCNENYARDLKITAAAIVGKTDYSF